MAEGSPILAAGGRAQVLSPSAELRVKLLRRTSLESIISDSREIRQRSFVAIGEN